MLYDFTLLVGALAGHLLDAALTSLLVIYCGGRELNPLFRPIAGKFLILAAVKIAVIGVLWHYPNGFFPGRRYSMRLLAIVGWSAAAWNAAWGVYVLSRRK